LCASRLVERDGGLGTISDTVADLLEVTPHGVGARKHERGAGIRAGQIAHQIAADTLSKDAPRSRPIQVAGSVAATPVLNGLHHVYVQI